MERPGAAVLVHLPHGHVRDHAGDRDIHVRLLQRETIHGGVAAFDEEVGRERLVVRGSITLGRGLARHEQGPDREHEHHPMR
jgi:hypothetical protein